MIGIRWLPLAALPAFAACGEASAGRSEVPATPRETSAEVVDWGRNVISLSSAGWSLEFCGGPFLCVARGNEQVGSVELFRLPVRDNEVIAEVPGRGGSEREALEAGAAEFLAVLSADGRIGFGEDRQLRADPPAPATVMGKPGLRLVLEERLAHRVLKRIVQYHTIDRDTFYLLAAMGTDGGGLDGLDDREIPRFADEMQQSPVDVQLDRASLEHEAQVQRRQEEWLRRRGLP
jgi:hypothetical protein